jgi:rhamnose utilization protein RhaD (predicted bifunctional aldolase and dehydrogenase)/NAD(P)-dependent dehydrogenase (short-subunit alcohol dehydrogenase family)
MTDLVTRALLDPGARRPSIETLLHAFLPFTHIDHVHADAICALTNHAEGERITREALGEGFAYVDWMRPGFMLSRIVGELAHYEGVVLAHHGLITWADDSDTCLDRTLQTVQQARDFISAYPLRDVNTTSRHDDIPDDELRRLLAQVRGAVSASSKRVLRIEPALRAIADRPDAAEVIDGGVSSADHMLRIKPKSAYVSSPESAKDVVSQYADDYRAYVERNLDHMPEGYGAHDPMPKVLLVPGLGALTTGQHHKEAAMAAEIAEHTHGVAATVRDHFGVAEPLTEVETFRFDYWPMELYKLAGKPAPKLFAGHVFIVTGAASGIGQGVARHVARLGASVVLADQDPEGLESTRALIANDGSPEPLLAAGDQSDPAIVERMVHDTVRTFGGLDGIVANAGIGVTGTLTDLTPEQWHSALQINLSSAFYLTKEALRVMQDQGIGGSLVYVASKNAFGPGAGFGAYSVSKAGMVQLMRIAALEGGPHRIRANAVNPDAVFDNSKLWDDGLREERAAAHGIAPNELEEFYASRNLLHRHVTTHDVAEGVAYLLSDASSRTTGAVIPIDGGVAAAFPR